MRLQRITAVAHPDGHRIDLTWLHPDPVQFLGVRVVRREGTHPTTPLPDSPGEGIVVADTNPTAPQRPVEVGENGLSRVKDAPLKGETVYYYALFPYAGEPPVYDTDHYKYNRTIAMASAPYNMAGQMAELLPAIYHRYDADRHKGQLRGFLDLPGSQLDQLYSFARAMLDLHNLDKVDGRLLPLLAQWIGWQTNFQLDIDAQRNEIKFAPHLYRSVGTAPNLQAIVHRYTGWHTQIAEFAQNIVRSNLPAQLNIFAITESKSGWNGPDLVTLEGAPRGRLSAFVDASAGIRLFYATADPQVVGTEPAAAFTGSGAPPSTGRFPAGVVPSAGSSTATSVRFVPQQPQGRLRYKTFRDGTWGESHALTQRAEVAQSDPAAVELPSDNGSRRIWLAWVDHAHTEADNAAPILGFGPGNAEASGHDDVPATPAALVSTAIQPFRLRSGMELVITVNRRLLVVGRFQPGDFVDIVAATGAEVAIVLNRTLSEVTATARADGRLELRSHSVGRDATLRVEQYAAAEADAAWLRFTLGTVRAPQDDIEWDSPQVVTTAPTWRHADLYAMVTVDGADRVVWLFWAMHLSANWCIVSARWDGDTWSTLEIIADDLGGNREPCAVLDQMNSIWVFWAQRQGVGTPDDTWTLRRRVVNPATDTWDAEALVTTPPPDGQAADREPGVVCLSNGDLRVFFRSNRAGGPDLWSLTVRPPTGEEVSAPSAITTDAAADHAPVPLLLPDNTLWLLYRSDRSVPLSRVATSPLPGMEPRATPQQPTAGGLTAVPLGSTRIVDTDTLRRFAGSTSLVPGDAARLSRHRLWDDLLAYTPQKPRSPAGGEVLQDDDFYTRATVGLYVSQVLPDTSITRQMVEQLRSVLARFLPINVRVVVILVPRPSVDRRILHANIVDQISADPANLTSLQWRAYFPDPL